MTLRLKQLSAAVGLALGLASAHAAVGRVLLASGDEVFAERGGQRVPLRVGADIEVGDVLLVGERPGLSSPDSLGIYLTWHPQVGRNDAQRNCISNVRPEGLPPAAAAARLWWLCQEARQLGLTGVGLKDRSDGMTLVAGSSHKISDRSG